MLKESGVGGGRKGGERGTQQAESEGEQSKVHLFRFMLSFVKFCYNHPRRSGRSHFECGPVWSRLRVGGSPRPSALGGDGA